MTAGVRERRRHQGRSSLPPCPQQTRAGETRSQLAGPSVGQYLARWLSDVVEPDLEPATYTYYEVMVRRYLIPALGSAQLSRLQTREVQSWLNNLARTCQCCAQGKDAARPTERQRCCAIGECCQDYPGRRTIQAARNTLRAALNHARLSEELVSRNVAALAQVPSPPRRRCRNAVWSVEEAARFLTSALRDDDPLYAAYVLLLVGALPRGKVLGLTWHSVDLDGGLVGVAWQLQRVRGRLIHKQVTTDSSANDDALQVPDICVAALRLRRKQQATARDAAGDRWQATGLAFTTRWGTAIEPRNFNRSFEARCAKAGIPRIRVHDTRHTSALLLSALAVDGEVATRILRHAHLPAVAGDRQEAAGEAARAALRTLADLSTGNEEKEHSSLTAAAPDRRVRTETGETA